MPKQMTVAVLGAGGTMGLPMARNIARAGLRVRAWNRSPEKMRPLADDGVHLANDARAAVEGADVVITMLADADAVLAVMGDAIDAMREGAVWLQTSTIGEGGIEACAELAEGHGIRLVDAPVLGTKAPAEQGELVVLGSGPEGLRDGLAPIFDAIAQRTMWVGETGAGTRLKVVVNSWIVTVVEGGAETIALAEGMGVAPTLLFEALEGGALDLPLPADEGRGDRSARLRPVVLPPARGQGRRARAGVRGPPRPRSPGARRDPAPARGGRARARRRGHERHLPDERAQSGAMSADRLHRFREKRDFSKTPEPRGRGRRGRGSGEPRFVIQKHAASSLHYDFRLEADGVLKSWAVPKGPSLDPREKRLAMPTEDHPLAYGDFEGVIPEGQYGAGEVIVWDTGTYRVLGDEPAGEALENGHLSFWLEGEKLRGGYALTRMGGDGRERWLLVKKDDEGADRRRNPVSTQPESVRSGKTIEQLARR